MIDLLQTTKGLTELWVAVGYDPVIDKFLLLNVVFREGDARQSLDKPGPNGEVPLYQNTPENP